MDTLYDLLGALPHDDADDLRAAFRRAVKGTHPDLRPGDPDAALKFRQIVRANEILNDVEQRAAYDHLLALARQEKNPASAHPIAAAVHRLASGVLALTGASIVAVGGYLVFMHMSMALVAPAANTGAATRVSAGIEANNAANSPEPEEASVSIAKNDSTAFGDALVPRAVPVIRVASVPAFNIGAPFDPAPNYARFFHARGVSAYRNGDLNGAIADLDQAIQLDPQFSPSYIDRGIVFYRMRKLDRALADIARAKRIEKQGHPKSVVAIAGKPRSDPNPGTPAATPLPPRRTTAQEGSSPRWMASTGTFQ
jgi:curved DNA-binding protein CbpA